jgi:hypothetical protein
MINTDKSLPGMRQRPLTFAALAALCLLLTACGPGRGAGPFKTAPASLTQPAPASPTAQQFSPLDHDPLIVQNARGTFHIAATVGMQPRELMFFYAMQAAQRGAPQVQAATSGSQADGAVYSSTVRVNSIQPLGRLAEFDAGVIRLAWSDHLGPNIVLSVTPPGESTPAWQMTLIDPQAVSAYKGTWWNWQLSGPLQAINQVEMACPCGNNATSSAAFRLALLGRSPKAVPPLYVKIDHEGAVTLLSEADWNALWPADPGRPPVPTEDLEHPYTAPTYPPTPTWNPQAPPWTPALPPPPPTALSTGMPGGDLPRTRPVPGVPAIQPTILDAGPDTPAFTAADVQRYHAATNLNGNFGMRAAATGQVTLDKITFLEEKELLLLHPDLELSDPGNRLLCYIEYSGTFQVSGPPGTTVNELHHAQEVYDAHTGNLLVSGVRP